MRVFSLKVAETVTDIVSDRGGAYELIYRNTTKYGSEVIQIMIY